MVVECQRLPGSVVTRPFGRGYPALPSSADVRRHPKTRGGRSEKKTHWPTPSCGQEVI